MLLELSAVIGGEEEQAGRVRGDKGDLPGHRRAVEIAQRPLCNKRQKFITTVASWQTTLVQCISTNHKEPALPLSELSFTRISGRLNLKQSKLDMTRTHISVTN